MGWDMEATSCFDSHGCTLDSWWSLKGNIEAPIHIDDCFDIIAEEVGVSASRAHRTIHQYLDRQREAEEAERSVTTTTSLVCFGIEAEARWKLSVNGIDVETDDLRELLELHLVAAFAPVVARHLASLYASNMQDRHNEDYRLLLEDPSNPPSSPATGQYL